MELLKVEVDLQLRRWTEPLLIENLNLNMIKNCETQTESYDF